MTQDLYTGREANDRGHKVASAAAPLLDAELISAQSNLIRTSQGIGVIKSSSLGNTKIGIPKTLLKKITYAYALLEDPAGCFTVYQMSKDFLEKQKVPASGKKEKTMWYYYRSRIERECQKIKTLNNLLLIHRRYWLTVHWPHRMDGSKDKPHSGIHIVDGRHEVGLRLKPGDFVAIYESASARTEIKKTASGDLIKVKCHPGKEGIVAFAEVKTELYEIPNREPSVYADKTTLWWRWKADAYPYFVSGSLPREKVNEILDYDQKYNFRGFGEQYSGLKEITQQQYERLYEAFRSQGISVKVNRMVQGASQHPYIPCGESPEHRTLKEAVAKNPSVLLKEIGIETIQMEYPFPTQDRADILLKDRTGKIIGLEIEVTVDETQLAGILQAIKYRYMGALMFNKRFEDSRSILVAYKITDLAKEVCSIYEVECHEITEEEVKRTLDF